jgi:Putative zinc-finger
MNEEFPKPMLDALARGTGPAEHPSADVLNAFVEHALTDGDKRSVADHLASCAECRDIVFLASSAAEEAIDGQESEAAARVTPRWNWKHGIAWAAPVAALLLLVGGYFVWQHTDRITTGPELASRQAAEAPGRLPEPSQKPDMEERNSSAVAASQPMGRPRVAAPPAKTRSAGKAQPAPADVAATNDVMAALAENKDLGSSAELSQPQRPEPTIAIGAPAAGVARAPKVNGFAQSADESTALRQFDAVDSLSTSVNRALAGAAGTPHPGWRIAPGGELEHLTSAGWTQASPEQKRVFRAVAVIGSQVWAGGDGGALFHSSDEGRHWNQASLATGEGAETAAIISIRFSDAQHGVVLTQGGTTYSTSDGGTTWTKQ